VKYSSLAWLSIGAFSLPAHLMENSCRRWS